MGNSVGKGGKVNKSSAENGLLDIASNLMQEVSPLRKEVLGQTLESLQTGGIGAQLPIAQRGIEASRAATASALSQLDENAARQGMGRSSAYLNTRANTLLSGEQATQAIPQQIAEQFIGLAPGLASGFTGQGLQGFTSSAGLANQRSGIQAERDIAKGKQQTEILKALSSGAGAAAAACWIAAVLFGANTPRFRAARRFIFLQWKGPLADFFVPLYLKHGRKLAKYPRLLWLLWPVFRWAAWRGRERG